MKTKKHNIVYEANEDYKGIGSNENEKPVYLRITYDRKNTKLKSFVFDMVNIKEVNNLINTDAGKREIAMIEQALAIETNNFVEPLETFKGFAQKFKFYLRPIDEVFKEYSIPFLTGPLLNATKEIKVEERNILNEWEEFLPLHNYLQEDGEFYQAVVKKPHVFINLLDRFLMDKDIKPEFKVLTELKDNIDYYLEKWNCLQDFMQSKYLENKDEAVVINWLNGKLAASFENYLVDQRKKGKKYSDVSVSQITLGLLHSAPYRDVFKKAEDLTKA